MVWRRRQQVREEVTGKLVPVEFELDRALSVAAALVWNSLPEHVQSFRTRLKTHLFGRCYLSQHTPLLCLGSDSVIVAHINRSEIA